MRTRSHMERRKHDALFGGRQCAICSLLQSQYGPRLTCRQVTVSTNAMRLENTLRDIDASFGILRLGRPPLLVVANSFDFLVPDAVSREPSTAAEDDANCSLLQAMPFFERFDHLALSVADIPLARLDEIALRIGNTLYRTGRGLQTRRCPCLIGRHRHALDDLVFSAFCTKR